MCGVKSLFVFSVSLCGFSEVMERLVIPGFSGLVGFLGSSEIG
jgi:hypothetical protein